MPMRCWRTKRLCRRCTRRWRNDIPRAVRRGRRGTPAEVVLRLLILKHIRNWSYEVLEREVRANLVYRDFTARRRRQDAGRQDDGALGCRARA